MLVNLDDMKTYLGISLATTDDDAFLTSQLEIVNEAIENYCRRKFDKRTYTQTFYSSDYPRSHEIKLAIYPVVSIVSIVQDAIGIADYRLHKPAGILSHKEGFFWGEETIIQYVAGYDYADMPKTLKSVVYSILEERYNKRKAGVALNFGSDVQRVSIPGTISIDFDYTLTNNDRATPFGAMLGNHLNILDFYRSDRAVLGSSTLTYVEEAP